MKQLLILLLVYCAVIAAVLPTNDATYIVRFPDLQNSQNPSLDYHTKFFAKLDADKINYISRFNFSSPALHGASISISINGSSPTDTNDEAKLAQLLYLRSLDGIVDQAWSALKVLHAQNGAIESDIVEQEEIIKTVPNKPPTTKPKSFVKRGSNNGSSGACPRSLPPPAQSPWNANHESTNVDKLHKRGIKGAGVTIAVIDTGIDASHPDFANKVIGGWDFVGDHPAPGSFSPGPDFTDKNGHGTQAAGIAAGNGNRYTGVAPDAKLLGYRVYSQLDSYVDEDTLLAAIERAYKDGADIISFSIGSPQAFAGNPVSVAADNLVKQGIVFVGAAGNNGVKGPYNPLNSGGAFSSLAVASVESNYTVTWPVTARAGTAGEAKYLTYLPTEGAYFNLDGTYSADYSSTNACEITARAGNSSLIVLPRGNCSDAEQFTRINGLGYKYALLINGPSHRYFYSYRQDFSKTLKAGGFIAAEHGSWFAEQANAGNIINFSFSTKNAPVPSRSIVAVAGYVNRITSWGPSYENYFYPSVAAPGGSVLAPNLGGGYLTVSGTSFATPYVAGVAALYLSSKGISRRAGSGSTTAALDFNKRLIGTAHVLDFCDGTAPVKGVQAPLIQQGAGLIDAVRVVDQAIQIFSDPLISLNDTVYRQAAHKIKIKNTSNQLLSYTVRHVPGTAVTVANSTGLVPEFPPPYFADKRATVAFVPFVWVLTPGHSTNIYAYFSLPKTTSDGIVYAGKLEITASNGDVVAVPYMGVQQNTNKLISPFPIPPVLLQTNPATGNSEPIPDDGSAVFNFADYNAPIYSVYSNFGSRLVSVDLVTSEFKLTTMATGGDGISGLLSQPGYIGPAGLFDPTGGAITFPQSAFPRLEQGYLQFPIMGLTKGFEQLSSGNYRVLTRALRPFGSVNKAQDWVVYLSPAFQVVYN
ncbi:hypothetical protein D0Z03_003025 [Geotrichum reessii]|nr:hypothetical protein D0Z03_003025 [Galactomyces reessii]